MSPVRGLRGGGWFGSAVPLRRFNRLPRDQAAELLQTCLPVERWVRTIIDARSFRTLDDLLEVAREAAFPFTPAELEAALAHGDVPVVVPPARRSDSPTEARVGQQLQAGVETYQRRFARPFVIRTTGRLPAQILVQLRDRLGNDIDTEDRVLAQQLREIALLKLADTICS
jgi:2-oxo-4-hydroxy-4-carboxy-5-ureidoimidazoline decarboxylase